ncbi:hypothetical protein GCM10008956_05380 [Deinococcus arenae]|uniref:Uncharacterized protein n=1 Tax=Deinococcus arenae TaxID=1452751 RepID=A0A8H9GJ01_9DEIO|nr:hypothetical protein GCM10008956_05380 [Deinococcus arenae]
MVWGSTDCRMPRRALSAWIHLYGGSGKRRKGEDAGDSVEGLLATDGLEAASGGGDQGEEHWEERAGHL